MSLLDRLVPVLRIGAILLLCVLLLWPMEMIRGLIRERQALRDQVLHDVARSEAGTQTLTGPLIIVPFTRTVREEQLDRDSQPVIVTREIVGELRLLPAVLNIDGELGTEERKRGIYHARVFHADTRLAGHFEIPAYYGVQQPDDYRFGEPGLVLGISDIRGIGNALTLRANGVETPFLPGTGTPLLPGGVHAALPEAAVTDVRRIDFEVALALAGTGHFELTPVGRETRVRLASDWPHPSFVGDFLPRTRSVTADGFAAEWQTSFFATNLEETLSRCGTSAEACDAFRTRNFGVSFIDPVDQYRKSERAAKYAFLFIGLTFAAFFLTEVLRRVNVHAVQYGLVGLALAMFFLLLVAFAEHLGFGAAYAVSATCCVGLVTYYVAHVLASRAQGAMFGTGLAALYGLLYAILSSEDYALLTGALLVFGLLATIMVLTRRVSWGAPEASR